MKFSSSKQLVIGLPFSGKTTFLAALWHVLQSEEIEGSLLLEQLDGNREHIGKLHENWLGCLPIERTSIAAERLVSMIVKVPNGQASTEICFPDMSGESFLHQCKDRRWTKDYDSHVREASGALVFIHPGKVVQPTRIDAADALVRELCQEENLSGGDFVEFIPWDEKQTPTQVLMVELLQLHAGQSYMRFPFKIAVCISAWDIASIEGKSPEEWLANRLPLLHQYLRSNREYFTVKVYGISAQGGDITRDSEALLRETKASERIRVVGESLSNHDITAPVHWLMT